MKFVRKVDKKKGIEKEKMYTQQDVKIPASFSELQ